MKLKKKFVYADDESSLIEVDGPLTLWVISDGVCDDRELINKKREGLRWAERALQLNRDQIRGQYSQEVILLQNYKWVLLKNYDDINHSSYFNYHIRLKMHLSTYQIEEMFFDINPRLKKLHSLKEEYISVNKSHYNFEEETKAA